MKKVIGILALAVIVIGGGIIYYAASNAESLVRAGVEEYGSKITKTQVTLKGVTLSPTKGEGALKGFAMGSPAGFKAPSTARFSEVSMKVDYKGSSAKLIHINEIRINAPEVTYELGSGGSNIDAIQKNVDAFIGAGGKKSSSSGEGPKIVIDNLYIKSGVINVSAAFLQGKALSTPLPDIHLKDIGKKEGGASPAEVADKLIDELKKHVGVGVSSLNLDKLMGSAGKILDSATGMATEGAKSAGTAVEGVVKGAGDAVGGAVKGVGDSIGGALKGILPGAK